MWLYMGELRVWADGNFLLLTGTMWFIFYTIWTCGLAFRHPDFIGMDEWTRIGPFVLALIYLGYYITGIIIEIMKVSSDETWRDSLHEIVIAYMLWINIPTALTMT